MATYTLYTYPLAYNPMKAALVGVLLPHSGGCWPATGG